MVALVLHCVALRCVPLYCGDVAVMYHMALNWTFNGTNCTVVSGTRLSNEMNVAVHPSQLLTHNVL